MKLRIIAATALAAVVLAGVYAAGHWGGRQDSITAAPASGVLTNPPPSRKAADAQPKAVPESAVELQRPAPVPAWARALPGEPAPKMGGPALALDADKADPARTAAVDRAINRLMALQTKEKPAPREVAAALADLEKAHGSSTFHGLKLDALRTNLELSQRMNDIAAQLEAMQRKAGTQGATPEMMAKVRELQALQSQLRMDLTVSDAPGATP